MTSKAARWRGCALCPGGNSYLCTGTLLNNRAADGIPYFLSGYHCPVFRRRLSSSTLTTDWFYRSSACNSGTLSPAARTLTGGAVLLYGASATDTSFMRLNNAPPPGVVFAGWSSSQPALGMAVLGLHNPSGDLQKYSIGSTAGFASCTVSTFPPLLRVDPRSCESPPLSRWSSGTTEGGSSGSGLFMTSNGNRYLIGQLHGGSSSCLNPSGDRRLRTF